VPHDPARREDGRGRDVRTGGHARALSHATRQRRNLRRYRAVECGNNEGRSPRQDLPLHGLQEGLASVSREETAPTPRTFGAAANGSRGARPVPPKLMCSRLRASRARSRPRIARIAPAMGRGVTSSWFLPLRRRRDELPGSCPSPPSAHGRLQPFDCSRVNVGDRCVPVAEATQSRGGPGQGRAQPGDSEPLMRSAARPRLPVGWRPRSGQPPEPVRRRGLGHSLGAATGSCPDHGSALAKPVEQSVPGRGSCPAVQSAAARRACVARPAQLPSA